MNVLVTGGAGFIGSNLVRFLIEQGESVTILDDLSSGYAANLEPLGEAKFIEGDVRDQGAVDRAIEGAAAVFHLAASVGNTRSIDNPIADSEINVLGTIRVLEAARRHGVQKVVYSSSAGIFGELKTMPITEDHPIRPITPYGASKLAAEAMCLAYADLYDLEAVCLRYFNVYGPNQRYDAYGNVIPIFAHRLVNGEPLMVHGDGEQTRDFVHVTDVARANYQASQAGGVSGAFNIASGTRISINRLVELMCAGREADARVEYGPPRPGDVRDSLADLSAAREAFGYEPQMDIETGVAEYMSWAAGELKVE